VEVSMLGSFFNTHPKPDMTEFLVFPKRNVYKSIYEDVDGKRIIIIALRVNYSK
jgi:hypothetical protein